jgi:ribosome biogenesis GTPase
MSLTGKIFKGIGGFYYIHTSEGDYECHAKGIFRNRKEKPLVGDIVELEPVKDSEKDFTGSIIRILPRKNQLIRPEVANVDQAVVVFALASGSKSQPFGPLLDQHGKTEHPRCDFFQQMRPSEAG